MIAPATSLSLVIPVHNEAGNVLALAEEIDRALESLDTWECIWVDDASTDATRRTLEEGLRARPRHRLLFFDSHQGQTAALLAGWRAARHAFVAGLDGDGQNDPADLPRLLRLALDSGLDMVNGVRRERRDGRMRRISSRIANGFRNRLTGERITDVGCSVRLLRREFVASIPPYRHMHRFLPTFVRLAGGKIGEADVAHRKRTAGRTKYGINNRLWTGILDTLAVRWIISRHLRLDASEKTRLEADQEATESILSGR